MFVEEFPLLRPSARSPARPLQTIEADCAEANLLTSSDHKRRVEFGDWQTPEDLALACCRKLVALGIAPDTVVEPTCGVGAFVLAAATCFPSVRQIKAYEVNPGHLATLEERINATSPSQVVHVRHADFFAIDWRAEINQRDEDHVLVLGNFPWVTSARQGSIGGTNLPVKSNFQGHSGFEAITGKANFDISEWMLLEVLRGFVGRRGTIAMLVKTAVARKVLASAPLCGVKVRLAALYGIEAKKHFAAAVDACLLVVEMEAGDSGEDLEYVVYDDLTAETGTRVGHRLGKPVGDLHAFDEMQHLVGASPQKWRSGVKHDASSVMEFTRTEAGMKNGLEEMFVLEETCLYPLLKGSDIGSGKPWREKFTLITQRRVGESTDGIAEQAPMTWRYLEAHAAQLDSRGSSIYAKNPRFSIFGIGDYAFRPWKIAICALYKKLEFRLVGPIEGKPVMFDDTVYYVSFETQADAEATLVRLNSGPARRLLAALIFWDEKRPIKTTILNCLDWTKVDSSSAQLVSTANSAR